MGKDDLKKAGLKVTGPRSKILKLLESSEKSHLSAEEIHKELSDSGEEVGVATVYRVLSQFEAAGLVIRHNFEGSGQSSVFELYDGHHHDHIICVKCGRVEEFVDDIIEERQLEIAKQKNFNLTDHYLHLYGECESCSSN